ncbi:MAG: tetratricopeptide repeat protein [Ignavibacteriae bacterium]|nr:tetratricopeptide repeat protein [Ignavibacteriota bacterium]
MNKFNEAIADLSESIRLGTLIPGAYHYRGMSFKMLGKYGEALPDLSKAIELNPYLKGLYFGRGEIHDLLGKYEEGIKDFTEEIRLSPDFGGAYYMRGLLQFKLKGFREAVDDYLKAIELNPSLSWAYSNAGYAYLRLHDYDNAIICFEKCLLNPKHKYDIYLGLALTYLSKGDNRQALKYLSEAIKDEPLLASGMVGISKLEERGMVYIAEDKADLKTLFGLKCNVETKKP